MQVPAKSLKLRSQQNRVSMVDLFGCETPPRTSSAHASMGRFNVIQLLCSCRVPFSPCSRRHHCPCPIDQLIVLVISILDRENMGIEITTIPWSPQTRRPPRAPSPQWPGGHVKSRYHAGRQRVCGRAPSWPPGLALDRTVLRDILGSSWFFGTFLIVPPSPLIPRNGSDGIIAPGGRLFHDIAGVSQPR